MEFPKHGIAGMYSAGGRSTLCSPIPDFLFRGEVIRGLRWKVHYLHLLLGTRRWGGRGRRLFDRHQVALMISDESHRGLSLLPRQYRSLVAIALPTVYVAPLHCGGIHAALRTVSPDNLFLLSGHVFIVEDNEYSVFILYFHT